MRERRWLPAARYMVSGEASFCNCVGGGGAEAGGEGRRAVAEAGWRSKENECGEEKRPGGSASHAGPLDMWAC